MGTNKQVRYNLLCGCKMLWKFLEDYPEVNEGPKDLLAELIEMDPCTIHSYHTKAIGHRETIQIELKGETNEKQA